MVHKGHIDHPGSFQAVNDPKDIIITHDEFMELLSPNAHGKPAGDFRLSDILRCLRRRTAPPPAIGTVAEAGAEGGASMGAGKVAEPAKADAAKSGEINPETMKPKEESTTEA